jgi:tRNA A37 N6-isopentenylltransferase MiaA
MSKDRVYDRITERVSEELNRDIAEEIKEMKMMRYYDEMPLIPKIPFNEYHEWMTRMYEWTTFKNYYEYPGAKKILEKYF